MSLIVGSRDAGRVHVCEHTHVVTVFRHVNGFALIPGDSFLVLGYGRRVPIPRQRISVVAAYLRVWPMLIGGTFATLGYVIPWPGGLPWLALSIPVLALWAVGFRLGRLSPTEVAQRRAYRAVTGFAADPALLAHGNMSLREHLRVDLEARAAHFAPDERDWAKLATSDRVTDPSFLAMALTLARIERHQAHDEIWTRLAPRLDEVPQSIQPLVTASGVPA